MLFQCNHCRAFVPGDKSTKSVFGNYLIMEEHLRTDMPAGTERTCAGSDYFASEDQIVVSFKLADGSREAGAPRNALILVLHKPEEYTNFHGGTHARVTLRDGTSYP